MLDRMAAGKGDPPAVMLVTGPAGAGKTTLLAEWTASGVGARSGVAWVTVEPDDGMRSLWAAIMASCEASGALPGRSGVPYLDTLPDVTEREIVAAFARLVGQASRPVWLVLDEVEHLADPQALRSLDLLLRWTPAGLRLVLLGRAEPAVALHKLRVQERLIEIRARDLALDPAEVTELLAGHGIRLDPDEVEMVLRRTEGLAAGVRMLAMSLEAAADRTALLADFAGDDRAVADYLVGEVLSRQPAHVRELLVTTSLVAELTPDLAALLSGREDAGQILEQLARANALVLRLGGQGLWYRCHPLLRSYLAVELDRRPPELRTSLHRRAARWLGDHGKTLQALEHAGLADDGHLVEQLIRESGLELVLSGSGAALARRLGAAPPAVRARPVVALAAAAAALDHGDLAGADEALDRLTGEPSDPVQRTLHATLRLHRARLRGHFTDELDALDSAPAGRSGDPVLDLVTLVERGTARLRLGRLDAAEADLQRAASMATAAHRDHVVLPCLIALAGVASSRNDFPLMTERAEAAIAFAEERGWSRLPQCAYAYVLAASGALQRLEVQRARERAQVAVEVLDGTADPSMRFAAVVVDAVAASEGSGDRHAQWRRARDAWPGDDTHVAPALVAHAAVACQRMALRVGEFSWATEFLRRAERRLGDGGEVRLLRATLQAHRGHADTARGLLRPVLSGEVGAVVVGTVLEAHLLEAVLADAGGDTAGGHRALAAALEIAARREALHFIVDGGRPVRELLVRHAGRFGRQDAFARRVLAHWPPEGTGPTGTVEQLTSREYAVLAELPSLRTAEEIAAGLFVSVNTVKTHLRSIYRKLGVQSRRAAIAAARQRGLL